MAGRPTDSKRKPKRRAARAGLNFPIARVKKIMRTGGYAPKFSGNTDLYLAAIVEYVVSEILQGAGEIARNSKRARLNPRALQLCIQNDADLASLLKGRNIREGGVLPYIDERLLPKKRKSIKN